MQSASNSMPVEIERKFVANTDMVAFCQCGVIIVQGYLFTDARNTIRIRRTDMRAFLTWKGPRTGCSREETEIGVPLSIGKFLLAIAPRGLVSVRRGTASSMRGRSGTCTYSPDAIKD